MWDSIKLFILKMFGKCVDEVENFEKTKLYYKIRHEFRPRYSEGKTFLNPFSQELDNLLCELMNNDCGNVLKEIQEHHIILSFKGATYKIWNANYPYSWLQSVEINGKRKLDDCSPNVETAIKFKIWLETHQERVKEINALKSKISYGDIWFSIVDNYFYLKSNNHYSHHTINSYMNEVIDLQEKCKDVMSVSELIATLEPHIQNLKKISDKAKAELNAFLKEQEEKERIEIQKAKDDYKNALIESSELIKVRYGSYCEDFKIGVVEE